MNNIWARIRKTLSFTGSAIMTNGDWGLGDARWRRPYDRDHLRRPYVRLHQASPQKKFDN